MEDSKIRELMRVWARQHYIKSAREQDYTVSEWLFNESYQEDLKYILEALKEEKFNYLRAKTQKQIAAGKLSESQIASLRSVLKQGFVENQSMQEIAKNIKSETNLKPLYRTDKAGNLILVDGEKEVLLSASKRAKNIARTEVVKISSKGAMKRYSANDIKEYIWVAAISDRTCEECMGLDNNVYPVGEGKLPPAHVACRCSTIAKIK
ncbi:MAG: minor capsid protein [Nanoarchaeota archaeon]|nr:minor capsid protein [Nanoarchaeota archaeon]MBU1854183.1 minor capsid protein [Nanoarchaeota archaeon]